MKTISNKYSALMISVFLLLLSGQALASIVITGTRVIYHQEDKEVSVRLKNVGSGPVLIQSWIDNGDVSSTPENIRTPFVITPPVNRVDKGKGQTLRVTLMDSSSFARDRESVAWLNVLEVPAINKEKKDLNTLQMAFRTRLKLFYRPAGLKGDANESVKLLTWSVSNGQLRVTNPTPYHVSLVSVSVNGKRVEGEMIAPLSAQTLQIKASAAKSVSGEYVNDFGAVHPFSAAVR